MFFLKQVKKLIYHGSCFLQITNYEKELEDMKNMTRQEFVASIRRLVSTLKFFLRSVDNRHFFSRFYCVTNQIISICITGRVVDFLVVHQCIEV